MFTYNDHSVFDSVFATATPIRAKSNNIKGETTENMDNVRTFLWQR